MAMVKILMATYNGENYLREQINSILAQTYHDWILYISDDVSSDHTPAIIEEYAKKYPDKIVPLSNKNPSGSAENNFFRMLSTIHGQYIALCDQDDYWFPDKLEVTLERMQSLERQYGEETPILLHTDLKVADDHLNIIAPSFFAFQNISPERKQLKDYLVQNNVTGCTALLNRSLLEKLDYIPEICTMHDWWLALVACCFGKIDYIRKPTMLYRQHKHNQIGAKSAKSLSFLFHKFRDRETVKKNYQKMFAQAASFLEHYHDQLTSEQIAVLAAFLKIPSLSRLGKIRQIRRYQFYKNSPLRTLGQFLSI